VTFIICCRKYGDFSSVSKAQPLEMSITAIAVDAIEYATAIDERSVLQRFYVNWALKEALVKASGCGITGFNLHDVRSSALIISDFKASFHSFRIIGRVPHCIRFQ
jgi:hypothetical protein